MPFLGERKASQTRASGSQGTFCAAAEPGPVFDSWAEGDQWGPRSDERAWQDFPMRTWVVSLAQFLPLIKVQAHWLGQFARFHHAE